MVRVPQSGQAWYSNPSPPPVYPAPLLARWNTLPPWDTLPPGYPMPPPATDIWWSSLETCLNLFTWGPIPRIVLTSSCGHQSGWYASYWNAFLSLNIFTELYEFCDKNYLWLKDYWWLIGVTLGVPLAFWPKILGGGMYLWMVLCHSMNAGSVVGIPRGGGNNQPYHIQKNLFEHFPFTGSGDGHLCPGATTRAQEPLLWNFHNI